MHTAIVLLEENIFKYSGYRQSLNINGNHPINNNMGSLIYLQCNNPKCQALGCRNTKKFENGDNKCKLCGEILKKIQSDDYDYKLHYTTTPHEEGLLPNRTSNN